MFCNPESHLPMEEILKIVWSKSPHLHAWIKRVSQSKGITEEEAALDILAEDLERRSTDSDYAARHEQEIDRRKFPLGRDPLDKSRTGGRPRP